MSSAPVSAYDVVGVRGRGYRPEQVDRTVAALSAERDEARERVARLTALVEELSAESVRLGEVVAGLAPQTYESLGERARQILALAESEDRDLRGAAQEAAQALRDAADAVGRRLRESARADCDAMRAAAGNHADQALTAATATAEETLAEARQEAARMREEAEAVMAGTRRRTASVLAHQETEHGERWQTAERELAEAQAAQTAHHDELTERAEARLAEARRALAQTEEAVRHGQEDAEAQGAELIAAARAREERVIRETERILREHEEGREEVRAHMTHVRNALAALTGRVTPDPAED
ncbi:cellulose-binding protein [Streptomyces sp. NBC_01217]|uniref:cellulose-binding protein n=1 Tax=Streptomyces sp. NBC_01217 TaxID=2903779 RepID=UPI002E0DB94A|nr:cellulose-binding protein [Streptomyces sp. NBC_01217]